MEERQLVAEALRLLGVEQLVLSIQDASFPASKAGELGRGSPYSSGGRRFLAFARALGFTGIQFGPQGLQDAGSASPYEAAVFSRNPLNVDPLALVEHGLLERGELGRPEREDFSTASLHADHAQAFGAAHRLLSRAFARAQVRPALVAELQRFAAEGPRWLLSDALYEVLCDVHRTGWWRTWSGPTAALDRRLLAPLPAQVQAAAARLAELRASHATAISRYVFIQWVLAEQHARLREELRTLGLRGYGDLQVGLSARDEWAQQELLLSGYRLGAPPSRTNPEGQPWNYPVLDPALFHRGPDEGPALAFLRARVRKLLQDHEGLRVDHPHGLVCPWVYRDGERDPLRAVQRGARLFASPAEAEHAALARYAIVRADQLDPDQPDFADARVRALDAEQVDRYAQSMDVVMEEAQRSGARDPVLGEVLSTMPYPLRRVFERYGLGRFRVTQKANPADPSDVYRSENAAPEDWVMLGNHDTPPIWKVIPRWRAQGELEARARYLAEKLEPTADHREAFAARLQSRTGAMAEALLADALACPAQHVQIFFADLLGLEEVFNTPGTVSPENWRLRVPPDYALVYPPDRKTRRALNLPGALALALRSKGVALASAQRELLAALDRVAAEA